MNTNQAQLHYLLNDGDVEYCPELGDALHRKIHANYPNVSDIKIKEATISCINNLFGKEGAAFDLTYLPFINPRRTPIKIQPTIGWTVTLSSEDGSINNELGTIVSSSGIGADAVYEVELLLGEHTGERCLIGHEMALKSRYNITKD